MKSRLLLVIFAAAVIIGCSGKAVPAPENTPVYENGRLQVIGNQICNENEEPVQLKGLSLMDVSWFGEYSNPDCLAYLRDDWNLQVYRAAMYTSQDGQYIVPEKIEDVHKAVNAAVETGVYVIIDWHILTDGDPLTYKDEAIAFFEDMAKTYRNTPNVIYEICNEPNGDDVNWNDNIRPYAVDVIKAIRKYDKKNLILVGTPRWSQELDDAVANPLDDKNLAYVLHFYAGTHGDSLRQKIDTTLEAGYPVFVTEWGTTRATGDGGTYPYQTFVWIDFLNERNISWANWSISSRDEDSAICRVTASPRGQWQDGDLSDSGLLVRMLVSGAERAVLFADNFDTESFRAGDWERESTGISRSNAYSGDIAARFRNNDSLTKVFSTKTFEDASIAFYYRTENWDSETAFRLEWFDGSQWQTALSLESADQWTLAEISLPEKANDNIRFKLRLVSDSDNPDAYTYIDDVSLTLSRIR